MRLAAATGDERWQPFDVFLVRGIVLLTRLKLLRLILLVLLLARIEWLLLAWSERLAGRWLLVAVVVAVVANIAALIAALLKIWLALSKLLLRRRDQAKVM